MEPGTHRVSAFYLDSGSHSSACVEVEYDFQPGHVYEAYRIEQDYDATWQPAFWDITKELGCPQKTGLADKIDTMLRRQGHEHGLTLPRVCEHPMRGFGEELTVRFTGVRGTVKTSYEFARYAPVVLVDGDDGNSYFIRVSQQTGDVEEVLGRLVQVGIPFISPRSGFQPLGSDVAREIVYGAGPKKPRMYKEVSPGDYEAIE